MILAFAAALRSTCLSRRVGCVIVRESHVIATGYNGTPKGTWHPEEFPRPCPCVGGVSGADLSLKYCAHAEANALAQSAYRGSSTAGADIFCTNFPCIECVKLLISAGHPHHLLRARVSRRQRATGPLPEPGGDPDASDPLVTNPAPSVDAGEGLAATTGSASTTKEMLIFGCGWGIGTEAAGNRTAQASRTTPQPRHPFPISA